MLARAHALLTSPRGVWCFLGVYVPVLLVLRLWLLPGASQDDAEQLLFAQIWAGGYNPAQPPLYTWLVAAAQAVLGVGLGAVVVVKFASLLAFYAFLFLAARRLLADAGLAALAALSPLALYYVAWDAVLNYSNTVLMAAACAATVYALARLARDGGLRSYLILGAAAGVGSMAKYGYALFFVALIGAALGDARLRQRLGDRRTLAALAVAVVIALPHLIWLVSAGHELDAALAARLDAEVEGGYAAGVANGLLKLGNAVIVFLFPLIVVLPLFFPGLLRRLPAGDIPGRVWIRLFERFFAITLVLIVAGILFFGVNTVRTHYMFILLPFPIYAFLRIEAGGAAPPARRAGYAAALIGLVALSLVALAVKGQADPRWCRKCYFHLPYAALAGELRDAGFSAGTVISHDRRYHMAGNFRRMFPESRSLSAKYAFFRPPPGAAGAGGQCLLVWRAAAGDRVPGGFVDLAGALGIAAAAPVRGSVEAPMLRSADRIFRINYALWPQGAGDCR